MTQISSQNSNMDTDRALGSSSNNPNSKQWFTTYFLQEAGAGKRCSECANNLHPNGAASAESNSAPGRFQPATPIRNQLCGQ